MAYGFRCIGDSGKVQIDDTYFNLCYIGGNPTQTDQASNTGAWQTQISYTGTNPVLAISSITDTYFILAMTSRSGNTWTWRIVSNVQNAQFRYYVFDRTPNGGTGGGYGLVIRDSANNITFNSNYKYMRVMGQNQTTYNSVTNETLIGSWGVTLAIVPGQVAINQIWTPDGGGGSNIGTVRNLFGTYKTSGNSVFAKSMLPGGNQNGIPGGSAPPNQNRPAMSCLILDVTGVV